MPDRPSQASIDNTTESWRLSGDRLRAGFLTTLKALERSRDHIADGYPTSSMSEGRGGGELTPTERAAHARWLTSNLERKALAAYSKVEEAMAAMDRAVAECRSVVAGSSPLGAADAEATNEAGGFCVNCARHGVQSVRAKGSRCDACYEYRRTHDISDRPGHLILAAHNRRCRSHQPSRRRVTL